jgi:hypothetical protein
LLAFNLLRPHLLKALRGTIAVIGIPLSSQALGGLTIYLQALRLKIGTIFTTYLRPLIPIQAQPAQTVKDSLQRVFNFPGDIGILNADNETAPVVAGKEPVKQGSPDIAHMGITGRTGSIANSDWVIHLKCSLILFLLASPILPPHSPRF